MLGKFYTPDWAARALLSRVPSVPTSILDLCCGEGALALAARRRWNVNELVTIDVDPTISSRRFLSFAHRVEHVEADGLADSIPEQLRHRRFDLVLCNPPFGRAVRGVGRDVLLQAGLDAGGCRPDLAMIGVAQALRLARTGGIVAAILPDTLITGRSARSFRTSIAEAHGLLCAAELPRRTFANTDAKAHLLVIAVGKPSVWMELERLDGSGRIMHSATVNVAQCLDRMDLTALPVVDPKSDAVTLATLGASVARGRLTSAAARAGAAPYFHTSDFSDFDDGNASFHKFGSTYSDRSTSVRAEPGDVLVARVDRRLEDKVAIVREGSVEITDCVFRVRSAPAHGERIWSSLRSERGRAALSAIARGVGPRHLAVADLLAIQV